MNEQIVRHRMRLIDANALDFDFVVTDDMNGMLKQVGIEMAKSRVDNAPTIDPESLRPLGEWVKSEDDYCGLNLWQCSLCHEEWCFEVDCDIKDLNYNYCPNCGARMKGAGEDAKAEIAQTVQDLRNER